MSDTLPVPILEQLYHLCLCPVFPGQLSYHRRERWHGHFTKTLELPFNIESGKVEAKFLKGVLHISLPRAEADKPRKITVKSA